MSLAPAEQLLAASELVRRGDGVRARRLVVHATSAPNARLADGQDRAGRASDDAFGDIAHHHVHDRAVAVVTRDRKASTSYIQRRLQIGYNRAATLMERLEQEGIIGQPNHAGKREILIPEEGGQERY